MNSRQTGNAAPQNEAVVVVETTSIHINEEKSIVYSVDKAFESLKLSIELFGIKEPLIVEKESNVVIAGNRRLKAALELGIEAIPVIFREMRDKDRELIFVTHENQREKTYSQYLAEYRILQKRYPLSQGARTDLKQVAALNAEALRILPGISRTTLFYLLEIDRLALIKYPKGKDNYWYKMIWNDLDEGYKTPKYWYDRLKTKDNNEDILSNPSQYSIHVDGCKFINATCEDVSSIEDGSIACFLSSPPYWGFKRKYGKPIGEVIGNEKDADEYLKKLVGIYKNALPKLKKGGSIWVNITDVCKNGEYQVIPHRFVLKMREIGLVLNDELIWFKTNPTPTTAKRTTRSFENFFQFVRSEDKKTFFYETAWLKEATALKNKVVISSGETEEKKITSTLNFRDGVLTTSSPNIEKLRAKCREVGIKCDHDATFPIDLAIVPILLTTKVNETVLDLFGGTGTVALTAGALGRKSISYEQNAEYCKVAEIRLTDVIRKLKAGDFMLKGNVSVLDNNVKVAA